MPAAGPTTRAEHGRPQMQLRAADFGRERMPVARGKNLRILDGGLGNRSFRGRICRAGRLCLTRAAPASETP